MVKKKSRRRHHRKSPSVILSCERSSEAGKWPVGRQCTGGGSPNLRLVVFGPDQQADHCGRESKLSPVPERALAGVQGSSRGGNRAMSSMSNTSSLGTLTRYTYPAASQSRSRPCRLLRNWMGDAAGHVTRWSRIEVGGQPAYSHAHNCDGAKICHFGTGPRWQFFHVLRGLDGRMRSSSSRYSHCVQRAHDDSRDDCVGHRRRAGASSGGRETGSRDVRRITGPAHGAAIRAGTAGARAASGRRSLTRANQ